MIEASRQPRTDRAERDQYIAAKRSEIQNMGPDELDRHVDPNIDWDVLSANFVHV